MREQEKISRQLKILTAALALMGAVFWGIMVYYRLTVTRAAGGTEWMSVFFHLAIAVLYFLVLYNFRNVCTQIAADNSFSAENAKSFLQMARCGAAASVVFLARLLTAVAFWQAAWQRILLNLGEAAAGIVFYVLCKCLARLIHNAYEIKQENDLTI